MALEGRRRERLYIAVLVVVCGLVFFLFLGRTPFHDKGEPREALVVRDIVLNGNWLFPLKMGEQIPSKPPLFHWAGAITAIVWGEMNEATVRFPSALFASLGVLLLYFLANKMFDSTTGLIAGVMLATSAVYHSAGVQARVDMTLTFCILLTLVLFYGIYNGWLRNPIWWYLFFLIAGASVMAKGPVSLILCGAIVALFLVVKRRWEWFGKFARHPGVILGLLACSLWYTAALYQGGSQFVGLQLVKENLARFFVHGEGGTGHQKPFHYFLPYLFTLGLPWTIFLPVVLWSFFREKYFGDDRWLFLGVWVGVMFVFFSLSAGKRPPYILPLYPAIMLLTAAWLRRTDGLTFVGAIYVRMVGWAAALIGGVLFLLGLVLWLGFDPSVALPYLRVRLKPTAAAELQLVQDVLRASGWICPVGSVAAAAFWLMSGRNLTRYNTRAAVWQFGCASILTIAFLQGTLLPGVANAQSYKEFVQTAKERVSGALLLYDNGVDYSSVFFYAGERVKLLRGDYNILRSWLEDAGHCVVIGDRQWRQLKDQTAGSFSVLLRSHGTGPDGDNPLVLIQGKTNEPETGKCR